MKLTLLDLQKKVVISSKDRREKLVLEMSKLEQDGVDCFLCSGVCCTSSSNSMQTTILETVDLLLYLHKENRINDDLIQKLKNTIQQHRLDKVPHDGKKFLLRRNYTCPFYLGIAKGCSISRWSKPYGCLAFNPHVKLQIEGGDCSSNIDLLESRDNLYNAEEVELNDKLQKEFNLSWKKYPLPFALLEVLEKISFD